jgi:hypothetical protein
MGIAAMAMTAACTRRPYQNPAYANLPHVNLSVVHGGGFSRMAGELGLAVELALAEDGIALAGGPREEKAPEFELDLIDRGILPGGERRVLDFSHPPEPYSGISPEGRADVNDGVMGSLRGDDARLVDVVVYMRGAGQQKLTYVGRIRGVLGYDFASPANMAEAIASLIRRALSS